MAEFVVSEVICDFEGRRRPVSLTTNSAMLCVVMRMRTPMTHIYGTYVCTPNVRLRRTIHSERTFETRTYVWDVRIHSERRFHTYV